jgi:branched-chain amino acid transport system permease protein
MDAVVIENLLQRIVTGVLVGSIYGLLCTGLGMIIGAMLATLFALGSASGAYLVIGVAAICLAGGGWALQRYVISHVSGSRVVGSDNEGHFAQLILTLGLSLVISNTALILFGSSPKTVQSPLASSSWTLGPFTAGDITVFVYQARAIGCLAAIIVSFALYLFVQKTRAGTSMRAAADNPTAATIVGIDIDNAYATRFGRPKP